MDPNQNNSGAPTLVIMAFLMGVAGVVVQSEYLKSARPPSFKSIVSHKVGMENVDARLWQDPLSAMNSDIKNQNKGLQHKSGEQDDSGCGNSHSFDIFLIKNEGKRNCFEYKDRTITFLGVTTRWGPYLEDQETRRNMRYAVVSGLTASDFIPDDPEHIGYMTHTNEEIRKRSRDEDAISNSKAKGESVDKSSAENNCGDRLDGKKIEDVRSKSEEKYPDYIPFEIFTYYPLEPSQNNKNESREDKVVILWLDDDYLKRSGQGPLKFYELVKQLVLGGETEDLPKNIRLKMIGPTSSGSLQSWLKVFNDANENFNQAVDPKKSCNNGSSKAVDSDRKPSEIDLMNIYSPYATVPSRLLNDKISSAFQDEKGYVISKALGQKEQSKPIKKINVIRVS